LQRSRRACRQRLGCAIDPGAGLGW
jgi:hypothetical protein